jgi:hypothetical protein
VPPPVLLAYFMAVVLFVVGLFSSIARATNLDGQPGWEWARVQPPAGVEEWGLILVYCAGVLSGQLAMAAGYARVRAGKAAFIALSELAFACACIALPSPARPPRFFHSHPSRPASCRLHAPIKRLIGTRAAAAAPRFRHPPSCLATRTPRARARSKSRSPSYS